MLAVFAALACGVWACVADAAAITHGPVIQAPGRPDE